MDGKSLRYLGLAVGLLGLLWLINQPASPPPVRSAQNPPAPKPETLREAAAAQASQQPWLRALWDADPVGVEEMLRTGQSARRALDPRGTPPLNLVYFGDACRRGESLPGVGPVTELLLDAGADVNAADDRGNTPLMLAAAECAGPIVELLLARGADPKQTNQLGLTAFEQTLTSSAPGGIALARRGFRLAPERLAHYRALYHDEPQVLEHLNRVDPAAP